MTVTIKNIFDAIADSPEDAADLKLRNALLSLVHARVKELGLSKAKIKDRLKLDDEAYSYFRQGGISYFTPGRLAYMLNLLGQKITIDAKNAT